MIRSNGDIDIRRYGVAAGRTVMICRTSVAAFTILATCAAPALSAPVLDVGTNACTKWIDARRASGGGADVTHTAWLYGYFSSAADFLHRDATVSVILGRNGQPLIDKADSLNPKYTDAAAINAWMDRYCRAHPTDKIADAAAILVSELKQKTGYLQEAVCETSDLKDEGRATCRNAFAETRRTAILSWENDATGTVVPDSKAQQRQPRQATKPPAPPQ